VIGPISKNSGNYFFFAFAAGFFAAAAGAFLALLFVSFLVAIKNSFFIHLLADRSLKKLA
jgi:uncharacterized membrane protein